VLQSGWERRYKRHFLGEDYSDIRETNVPKIRLMYRRETLDGELSLLPKAAAWQDDARAFMQGTPKPK
jgi:AMP deaminase